MLLAPGPFIREMLCTRAESRAPTNQFGSGRNAAVAYSQNQLYGDGGTEVETGFSKNRVARGLGRPVPSSISAGPGGDQ